MESFLQTAAANLRRAHEVAGKLEIEALWREAGVEPRLVGSVRTGLLMDHLDIDYHLYSPKPDPAADFELMGRLAARPGVEAVHFVNGLASEEECMEWHVAYRDREGALWQIDMIHMRAGSRYDGHFERVADRIRAALTEQTRTAILRLKHLTRNEKIAGVEYCRAVMQGGVRTPEELAAWRATHPLTGVDEWMP